MKRFIKNIFIPNKGNKFEPYGIRFKVLAFYLIILIVLQLGVSLFAEPKATQRALAATEITSSDITALTNAQRAAYGLPALSGNGLLDTAAYNKCVDMFANQYWDHTSPSGLTPWYFISQSGYAYVYAGENLAKGFTSSNAIVNAWMNSPSHRENILSSNFSDTGTAIMTGNFQGTRTTLCVQMFGSQANYTPAPGVPGTTEEYQPPVEQPVPSAPAPVVPEQPAPPAPPEITKPENGTVINDNKPVISGKAAKDSQITIYDSDVQMGSQSAEPEGIFIFKPVDYLKDGEHKVSADSAYKNSSKSGRSKVITFTIDTVPPLIEENSLNADIFSKRGAENYKVAIQVEENPQEVTASLDHYALILNEDKQKKGLFTGTLIPPQGILTDNNRQLNIQATDKASNKATYLINISQPPLLQQGILEKISSAAKTLIPHDFQSIVRLLYFLLGFWIFMLILIDGITIYVKGIVRVDSHSYAHLAIIFLMLVGILFASLGHII